MGSRPLRYHRPFAVSTRIVLGAGAMIPLWGAHDLLVRPGVSLLQWGMAPFIVMGLIALCFGGFFLAVAVFGGARTVTIDRASRVCHVDYEGRFGLRRRQSYPLSGLKTPHVIEQTNDDGPSRWAVELQFAHKAVLVETYKDEAEARAAVQLIAAYVVGA